MKKKRQSAKDVVLPHSQAKLDLYSNYLKHYLRVLSLSTFIDKINLYDAFCGVGIYKDGKEGSPLITNKCIAEIHAELQSMNKPNKPISISVNDYDKKKILNVEQLLSNNKLPNCTYSFNNLDANNMLDKVFSEINAFSKRERNLIFIDPYGYSPIKKDKLYNLLHNDRTEIILFLPVSQMYRFKEIAFEEEDKACYENLRIFLNSFLNYDIENIEYTANGIFDFINEIKIALSFNNKYYTCSHFIQRGGGNYNALFFITANIYGLDKMIETKWKLDPNNGEGFIQSSLQANLFEEQFVQQDKSKNIEVFIELIIDYLNANNSIDNCQLYELGLINEFTPKQSLEAINHLHQRKKIKYTMGEGNPAKYINYTHYKNQDIKFRAKLN